MNRGVRYIYHATSKDLLPEIIARGELVPRIMLAVEDDLGPGHDNRSVRDAIMQELRLFWSNVNAYVLGRWQQPAEGMRQRVRHLIQRHNERDHYSTVLWMGTFDAAARYATDGEPILGFESDAATKMDTGLYGPSGAIALTSTIPTSALREIHFLPRARSRRSYECLRGEALEEFVAPYRAA